MEGLLFFKISSDFLGSVFELVRRDDFRWREKNNLTQGKKELLLLAGQVGWGVKDLFTSNCKNIEYYYYLSTPFHLNAKVIRIGNVFCPKGTIKQKRILPKSLFHFFLFFFVFKSLSNFLKTPQFFAPNWTEKWEDVLTPILNSNMCENWKLFC